MALGADTLLDRIQLKGQLTRWRIAAILLAVLAILIGVERFSSKSPIQGSHIARLDIEGVIADDTRRDELIQDLIDDKSVKAVIVRLDTPGGTAVGGEELYRQLKDLSAKKPVVAVMRTMATSAGYMVALGTDHIFARESTITGSIGVIFQSAEVTELAKKLGITPQTIKSGPYKASPSPFEKMTPDQEHVVEEAVTDTFNMFVDMVVEGRKLPREEVVKLADGRIYTGRQAINNKLVDSIGGEKEAVDWLVKNRKISASLKVKKAEIKEDDEPWLARYLKESANSMFPNLLTNRLDGLLSIWQANTL